MFLMCLRNGGGGGEKRYVPSPTVDEEPTTVVIRIHLECSVFETKRNQRFEYAACRHPFRRSSCAAAASALRPAEPRRRMRGIGILINFKNRRKSTNLLQNNASIIFLNFQL